MRWCPRTWLPGSRSGLAAGRLSRKAAAHAGNGIRGIAEAKDRLADLQVPSTKVTPVLTRLMITGRIAINRNFQRKRSNTASSRSCRGACRDGLPMGDRQRGDQEHGKDWVARRRLVSPPLFSLTAASGDANPGKRPPPALGWPAPRFAPLPGPPCSPVCLLNSPPCSRCAMCDAVGGERDGRC